MENQKGKDKYNERVQALAEKMAKAAFNEQADKGVLNVKEDWEYFNNNKQWLETHMPFAQIAVAEMAEAVICYAYGSVDDYKMFQETGDDDDYMARHLKEQGLIPDEGQEAGSDAP